MIAVVLFLIAHALGLLQIPLEFDPVVLKGLIPMIGLNVIGLRCVHVFWYSAIPRRRRLPEGGKEVDCVHRMRSPTVASSPLRSQAFPVSISAASSTCSYRTAFSIRFERRLTLFCSFSNYTLKYVDASFYQVARGMVLPFTVATSFVFLQARPSLMVLLACSMVTFGFFIGVFLDGTPVSLIGITFGVASSMITAMHSVVIKKSLEVVKGSALHLSWYTNLISAIVLMPLVLLAGEGSGIYNLFFGLHVVPAGGVSPLNTFLWGSAITVRFMLYTPR